MCCFVSIAIVDECVYVWLLLMVTFVQLACEGASRGKEWDVFVSHSTGDKPWAREKVIVPLRNPPLSLKVSWRRYYSETLA